MELGTKAGDIANYFMERGATIKKEDYDFVLRLLLEIDLSAREATAMMANDCVCKEKWTFGVVHRKDNPCYWAPPTDNPLDATKQ